MLKEVDRNTKYFQTVVAIRRRKKLMVEIKKGRRMLRDPKSIKREVKRFYMALYKQHRAPAVQFEDGLVNKISVEDAGILGILPSMEEIKCAVWSCDSSKAPSAYVFNLNFIRKCWDIIGGDFSSCALDFFVSGTLPRKLNMVRVTLIPKFEGAMEVKHFRPISMVGCVYNVIAKIMAKRIRNMMGILVGKT